MDKEFKDYWYATPDIFLRHSPNNGFWWVGVMDSNNSIYVPKLDENIEGDKYVDNGFLHKEMWSISVDTRDEAIKLVKHLGQLFKTIHEKEYVILGKTSEFKEKDDVN